MIYRVPSALVHDTFAHLRHCGRGERECQLLWTSAWGDPAEISQIIHPRHRSHSYGFDLDNAWLNGFWLELARTNQGIRFQVHSHPCEAFHSKVDDQFPIVQSPGFLSLVIPNFGMGPIDFDAAFLTEIQANGEWREVPVASRLEITI